MWQQAAAALYNLLSNQDDEKFQQSRTLLADAGLISTATGNSGSARQVVYELMNTLTDNGLRPEQLNVDTLFSVLNDVVSKVKVMSTAVGRNSAAQIPLADVRNVVLSAIDAGNRPAVQGISISARTEAVAKGIAGLAKEAWCNCIAGCCASARDCGFGISSPARSR